MEDLLPEVPEIKVLSKVALGEKKKAFFDTKIPSKLEVAPHALGAKC